MEVQTDAIDLDKQMACTLQEQLQQANARELRTHQETSERERRIFADARRQLDEAYAREMERERRMYTQFNT